MPVYEYECTACGQITEALRRIGQADDPVACEHCEGKSTKRTHSVFATGSASADPFPGPGPCGTCGNPNGSCQM